MRSRLFVFFFALAASVNGWACSFAQPKTFLPTPLPWAKSAIPKPPVVESISVRRGYKADPKDSCADTGVVVVKLIQTPGTDIGFQFSVVTGEADDQIFPDAALFDTLGVYVFPWVDGARDHQEPLDLLVRVVAINRDGEQSQATEFRVFHDGRPTPRKP